MCTKGFNSTLKKNEIITFAEKNDEPEVTMLNK